MADIQLIRGSNGNGPAVRPVVTAARLSGSLTIKVNNTTNLPPSFIGTWGKLNQDTGKLISSSIRDFYGTVNGADIDLVRMADGFTDDGNEVGDVIVIKPNTDWANNLADALLVSHNPDGTLKDTGWVALTAASGYTINSARARYFNGVVYLKGQVTKNSGSLSNGVAAYIPSSIPNPDFTCQASAMGAGTYTSKVAISTNGHIQLSGPNNSTNYFWLDTQYPVGS